MHSVITTSQACVVDKLCIELLLHAAWQECVWAMFQQTCTCWLCFHCRFGWEKVGVPFIGSRIAMHCCLTTLGIYSEGVWGEAEWSLASVDAFILWSRMHKYSLLRFIRALPLPRALWAIELKRHWRAPRQDFCRLFCIISVIHYFLHSGRMHSSGNSHSWTERWLFLITQVSKPQAKEGDAYTSHKRSNSLCWAGELLRMFIADNGLYARGDVPSHVLEEGLQMSPATGALPLLQWV